MTKKIISLIVYTSTLISGLSAQNIDSWQVYPSFSTINSLYVENNTSYCATMGGITVVRDNQIILKLTTMDGLYRSDPTAIIYDSNYNNIIAGYIDGTIDIINVETQEVEQLKDINRVTRFNSTAVNSFSIDGENLYVSTSFGIVIYDLNSLLVDESYLKLGAFNTGTEVAEVRIVDNYLYAATAEGAAVKNLNVPLSDWQNFASSDLPSLMIDEIEYFNSIIYALMNGEIYEYRNDTWLASNDFDLNSYQTIATNLNKTTLVAATNNSVSELKINSSLEVEEIESDGRITDLFISDSKQYFGTSSEGLLVIDPKDNVHQYFLSSGPYLNFFSQLLFDEDVLVATSTEDFPGIDPFNPVRGYYIHSDEVWQNYNINTNSTLNSSNFTTAYSVGQNDSSYFVGSWGSGIAEHQKKSEEITVYDNSNSSISGIRSNPNYVVISGLQSDSHNNMWAVSYLSEYPLNLKLSNTNEWIPFRTQTVDDEYFHLFVDSYDQKWISLITTTNSGRGLLIVDTGALENPEDDNSVKLTSSLNNGNLPHDHVNAIIEDKNGEVWIGTSRGIAKFIFPELLLSGGANERNAQWLINEDTTAASRYLLREVNVTAIAVNDANEKWIGSANQGLWLLNEEGSRIEKYFNTENSELISNSIQSIAVNNQTGEVFVSTNLGLVSFNDVPKAPVAKMDNLKVFPNPFVYSKHSQVLIEGLSDKTIIKVLGIDGMVVNEIAAQGGRASWNGLDYNGNQLGSGVYFVIAYEPDGDEKGSGKVVIIR